MNGPQTASVAQRPQAASTAPLPTRRLGKTGLRVPLVGYGTAPGGSGLSDREAIELLHQAIDRGVTYLDTAPAYERAQRQLRSVLAERRDEVIVATKVPVDGAAEALASLTGSLQDLGTDHVDIAYVHSLGGRDVDRVLAADGALAGLRQAQRAGMTRFVGFTSHNRPRQSTRVLRECEVDVIMVALNYGDQHTYGFERQVLPEARRHDVGVAAMKVYGGASRDAVRRADAGGPHRPGSGRSRARAALGAGSGEGCDRGDRHVRPVRGGAERPLGAADATPHGCRAASAGR